MNKTCRWYTAQRHFRTTKGNFYCETAY